MVHNSIFCYSSFYVFGFHQQHFKPNHRIGLLLKLPCAILINAKWYYDWRLKLRIIVELKLMVENSQYSKWICSFILIQIFFKQLNNQAMYCTRGTDDTTASSLQLYFASNGPTIVMFNELKFDWMKVMRWLWGWWMASWGLCYVCNYFSLFSAFILPCVIYIIYCLSQRF